MLSKETMRNASYVYCYSVFMLCALTFVSIVVSKPPVIYTYKSIVFALVLSSFIIIATVFEVKLREMRGFSLKQAVISLFPSTLLILFSLPSFAWLEYHFSDFGLQTVVNVEDKEIIYYRNSVSCYELSLRNSFINGDLCSSPSMYVNSPIHTSIDIRYKVSLFGYLVKN